MKLSTALLFLAACGTSTEQSPDAPTCTSGIACSDNPGAACKAGVTTCDGDAQTCVDATDVADGTACGSGVCTRGTCIAPVTASGAVDVSTMPMTQGRTCAESPAFSVAALGATGATLATAADTGCLAAGDEVLLIDLQGAPGATANVGTWELLEVASASGAAVTFTSGKTRSYGAVAGSDAGIGVGATDQKVALVRVAQFGTLAIDSGATLTTSPWNGLVGGVIAMRASTLTVDGAITVAGLGYRGGRWSQDDASCTENQTTDPGESIAGPAVSSTDANFGAPGGIGSAGGISFIGSTPTNSGASHATLGTTGSDANGRVVGAPGAVYGANDASTLTLGSGDSGNLTCTTAISTGPILITVDEQLAGGIVLIFAQTLTVGASGSISASSNQSFRDVTAAGGEVFLHGGALSLGDGQVTAVGGTTHGSGNNGGNTVHGGDGYIVVQGSVMGTTTPAAHQL